MKKKKTRYFQCSTNLECCVKHHQLGACGHDVVALVGFHKSHVNVALRFSSCKGRKEQEKYFQREESHSGAYNGNKTHSEPKQPL